MNTLFIALNQIRLFSKSSGTLALFIIGPVFLIYVIAQAFTGIFASGGQGLRVLDYFGVTILTLTVFQGTSVASWAIFKDKRSNTEVRISLAPVKKWEFLCGTFLGVWISLAVLSCAIFILLIRYQQISMLEFASTRSLPFSIRGKVWTPTCSFR